MLDRVVAVTRSAVDIALGLAGEIIDRVRGIVSPEPEPEPERKPQRPARPAPPPAATRRAPMPTRPEPEHIEVEDELVGAFAEAGAEDGAGPEIEVAEPWPGYAALTANDVVDRLAGASEAERAVVALYERDHKKRKTVLAAAERR